MSKEVKLVKQTVCVTRDTRAQLSAISAYRGVPKQRLAGELLAKAVEILYDEVFGVADVPAKRKRASTFDAVSADHKE